MSETVKLTVNLPGAVVSALRRIARERDITLTEAINQSIKLNNFMLETEQADGKVLVERSNGKLEKIVSF